MDEMELEGISVRPVFGSYVAPGIAFRYVSKAYPARRISDKHDANVRSSTMQESKRKHTRGTSVDNPRSGSGEDGVVAI